MLVVSNDKPSCISSKGLTILLSKAQLQLCLSFDCTLKVTHFGHTLS